MGGWQLAESKWHNPYKLSEYNNDLILVLSKFEDYLRRNKKLMNELQELKGKRLGCFCKGIYSIEKPICHGDILIKVLNEK